MQEPCSISNFLQEPRTISIFRMNHERYLLFARIVQDSYFFQKSCKISIKCKNLATDIILTVIVHCIFSQKSCQYYLEESGKTSVFCKNIARYLTFSKISQDNYHMQEPCRISQNLQESCTRSIICKNHEIFFKESRKI